MYKKCIYCGSNNDPGERCDCRQGSALPARSRTANEKYIPGAYGFDVDSRATGHTAGSDTPYETPVVRTSLLVVIGGQ